MVSAARWTERMNERMNEQISRNPRRVAHCRVSSLVMVCRRSFAAKANLLAIETALLTRRQQSADHNRDKVCQVGVTVNTSGLVAIALGFDRLFLEMSTTPRAVLRFRWNLQVPR